MQEEADLRQEVPAPREVSDRSTERQAMPPTEDQVLRELAAFVHDISLPMVRFNAGPTKRKWFETFFTQWQTYFDQVVKVLDSRVTQLETSAHPREELQELEEGEEEQGWPEYASEDLLKLVTNVKGMQDSVGDASQMLFHAMEMETLLGHIEEKARLTSRKYEARLAASLRDICRVHDPSGFSQEQVECLKGSVTALVEGWGKITREKVHYVRTRLLDKGLTWLPVTDKAIADVEEARAQNRV